MSAPQPSQSGTCVRNSPQASDTSYDVQAQAERPPSESDNYIDAELWRDLCEKSDRTSPEGQPDMALINQAEFFDYLAAARAQATLAADERHYTDPRERDGAPMISMRIHREEMDEKHETFAALREALKGYMSGNVVLEEILWGEMADNKTMTIVTTLGVHRRARAALEMSGEPKPKHPRDTPENWE